MPRTTRTAPCGGAPPRAGFGAARPAPARVGGAFGDRFRRRVGTPGRAGRSDVDRARCRRAWGRRPCGRTASTGPHGTRARAPVRPPDPRGDPAPADDRADGFRPVDPAPPPGRPACGWSHRRTRIRPTTGTRASDRTMRRPTHSGQPANGWSHRDRWGSAPFPSRPGCRRAPGRARAGRGRARSTSCSGPARGRPAARRGFPLVEPDRDPPACPWSRHGSRRRAAGPGRRLPRPRPPRAAGVPPVPRSLVVAAAWASLGQRDPSGGRGGRAYRTGPQGSGWSATRGHPIRMPPRTRNPGGDLLSQGAAPQVPSARAVFTSVFGMGTGVSPPQLPPETWISKDLSSFKDSIASTSNKDPKPSAD